MDAQVWAFVQLNKMGNGITISKSNANYKN